jgi:TonB family protein
VVGSDEELPPPVDVSHHKKSKPTVEVASTGTTIPVPVNGAPPASPAVSAELEKSVVPLKPKHVVETASAAPPTPVPVPAAVHTQSEAVPTVVTPQMTQVQARPVEIPIPPPQQQHQQAPPPQQTIAPTPQPAVATNKVPASEESVSIPAKVMQKTAVRFPPAAAAQHIEGTVELITVVKADGHVKDVKVVKGNPFLVQAAVSSVREWVYEPAYLHGKPIESEVSIVLNFKRPE